MSNRLTQTRPIFALSAIAILYIACAEVPPAQAQPEAQAASIVRDYPDRSLYIKPTTGPNRAIEEISKNLIGAVASKTAGKKVGKTVGKSLLSRSNAERRTSASRSHRGKAHLKPAQRSLKAASVHRMKRHQGYIVDVTYPQFHGADAQLVAQLNRKAKSVVNANIPNKPGEFSDYEYEYTSNYKSRFVSSDLVSAEFEFNLDNGGAHGVTTLVPFNYQITDGIKELTLDDLFGKPVDYDTLANLCFTKLQEEYSEELLYDEADALLMKDQDFSIFTFDANGVTFSFNQGDIAPYDVGCPSVTLSYFELRKLISGSSPVHKFLERNAHAHPHAIKAHCAS